MPKLKSLRAASGSYGRVAANGIIDVDDAQAKQLKATKRFLDATPADIEAAQKRQADALAKQVKGAAPGFAAIAEPPAGLDRVQDMIARGAITPEDARRLAAYQIELSPAEIQTLIREDAERATAEIETQRTAMDARQAELDARQAELDGHAAELADREQSMADAAKDLDAREAALHAVPPAAEDGDATDTDAADQAEEAAPAGDTGAAKRKGGK